MPFPLFTHQDSLLRNGWYDIYIEDIYGKAENKLQYESWNKFHTGSMDSFSSWQIDHSFIPTTLTGYANKSDSNLRKIFAKKKKR